MLRVVDAWGGSGCHRLLICGGLGARLCVVMVAEPECTDCVVLFDQESL